VPPDGPFFKLRLLLAAGWIALMAGGCHAWSSRHRAPSGPGPHTAANCWLLVSKPPPCPCCPIGSQRGVPPSLKHYIVGDTSTASLRRPPRRCQCA